jgi:CRISPR-associated protein Cmr4
LASKTFSELGVLGLYTETALHCGAEGGTGYVDLPIQRERHTHYPLIPGSTVKGVLRDELAAGLGELVDPIFGKDDAQSPGSVSFGDAILVAFPVRSSGAPFHWITCPFVLERAFRTLGATVKVEPPASGHAWAQESGRVLLEELRIEKDAEPVFFSAGNDSGLALLLRLLPSEARGFAYTRSMFGSCLLILADKDFKELIETATEVVTRIKLNKLGTTTTLDKKKYPDLTDFERQGNLFVEEVVPPESLFLAPLRGNGKLTQELAAALGERPVVRLGGDETIGRGVTHMTFVSREGA